MAIKTIINLKHKHDWMMNYSQLKVLFHFGKYYEQMYGGGGEKL
jgi:hypothetical protein